MIDFLLESKKRDLHGDFSEAEREDDSYDIHHKRFFKKFSSNAKALHRKARRNIIEDCESEAISLCKYILFCILILIDLLTEEEKKCFICLYIHVISSVWRPKPFLALVITELKNTLYYDLVCLKPVFIKIWYS